MQEICTLRAIRRALETESRTLLTGHEGGNAGNSQDAEGSYAGGDPIHVDANAAVQHLDRYITFRLMLFKDCSRLYQRQDHLSAVRFSDFQNSVDSILCWESNIPSSVCEAILKP